MNYLDEIADAIRGQLAPEHIPEQDAEALFRLYALLALAKGQAVDARDVHDAWTVWTLARNPAHAALVPFEELAPDVQAADLPFVEAIRRVVASR